MGKETWKRRARIVAAVFLQYRSPCSIARRNGAASNVLPSGEKSSALCSHKERTGQGDTAYSSEGPVR